MSHKEDMSRGFSKIIGELMMPDKGVKRAIISDTNVSDDDFSTNDNIGVYAMGVAVSEKAAKLLDELAQLIKECDGPVWRIELDGEKIDGIRLFPLESSGYLDDCNGQIAEIDRLEKEVARLFQILCKQ